MVKKNHLVGIGLIILLSLSVFSSDPPEDCAEKKKWQTIKLVIENYAAFLKTNYSCCFSKYYHEYFVTNYKKYINKKLKNIEEFLLAKSVSQEELAFTVGVTLQPYRYDYCKKTFDVFNKLLCKNNSFSRCPICHGNNIAQVFAVPCGHTIGCSTCAEKIIKENSRCPYCMKKITQTKFLLACELEKKCVVCKKSRRDIYCSDCQHLCGCSSCEISNCPLCKSEKSNLKKIFCVQEV